MVELDGKPAPDVRLSFAGPVAAAREVDAQERPIGSATSTMVHWSRRLRHISHERLHCVSMHRTPKLAAIQSKPVALQYDLAVATNDDTKTNGGGFDGKGNAIPAEMLPDTINYHDVQFKLAPSKTGYSKCDCCKRTDDQTARRPIQPCLRAGSFRRRRPEGRFPDWRTGKSS